MWFSACTPAFFISMFFFLTWVLTSIILRFAEFPKLCLNRELHENLIYFNMVPVFESLYHEADLIKNFINPQQGNFDHLDKWKLAD